MYTRTGPSHLTLGLINHTSHLVEIKKGLPCLTGMTWSVACSNTCTAEQGPYSNVFLILQGQYNTVPAQQAAGDCMPFAGRHTTMKKLYSWHISAALISSVVVSALQQALSV